MRPKRSNWRWSVSSFVSSGGRALISASAEARWDSELSMPFQRCSIVADGGSAEKEKGQRRFGHSQEECSPSPALIKARYRLRIESCKGASCLPSSDQPFSSLISRVESRVGAGIAEKSMWEK